MRVGICWWLLVFTVLLGSLHSHAQRPHIHFEHITSSDGLADNTVNVIMQDSRGFLWIGTQDGLNRYDGYEYKLYQRDTTAYSLTNNTVDCIYENEEGDLWIGTFEGVNIFERSTGRIRNYLNDSTFSSQKLLTSGINDIIGDDKGNYWLATGWQGLVMLRDNEIKQTFQIDGEEGAKLPSNTVTTLARDGEDIMWVGTTNGFCKYDLRKQQLKPYFLDGDPLANSINKIHVTDTYLWIGTKTGLVRFDKNTEEVQYFITDPLDPMSILNRVSVKTIYQESPQKLWLGTEKNGLLYFDTQNPGYFEFTHESNCNLSSNEISSFFLDNAGTIWVGTHAAGLNFSNYQTNMFTNWLNTGINENGLGTGSVACFHESNSGDFWVGVNGGGITV